MSSSSLDLSREEFEQLISQASEIIVDRFNNLGHRKAFHDYPQKEVESWFNEKLPEDGIEFKQVLQITKKNNQYCH